MFCKNILIFVLSNLQRTILYTAKIINYIFLTFSFDEFLNYCIINTLNQFREEEKCILSMTNDKNFFYFYLLIRK